MLIDRVDTLHVGRYWSEVLCSTVMTYLGDLEVKITDFFGYGLNLLNMLMDKVDTCMLIDIGLRFYAVHHNSSG